MSHNRKSRSSLSKSMDEKSIHAITENCEVVSVKIKRPPTPPPQESKPKHRTSNPTPMLRQSNKIPPPAPPLPKNNRTINKGPPTPPPQCNKPKSRPISSPPGSLIKKLRNTTDSQENIHPNTLEEEEEEENEKIETEKEIKVKINEENILRKTPPKPPPRIKHTAITVAKPSSIPQPLTPRTVAQFPVNTSLENIPNLPIEEAQNLIPKQYSKSLKKTLEKLPTCEFQLSTDTDKEKEKEIKQENRKSMPIIKLKEPISRKKEFSDPHIKLKKLKSIEGSIVQNISKNSVPDPPPRPPRKTEFANTLNDSDTQQVIQLRDKYKERLSSKPNIPLLDINKSTDAIHVNSIMKKLKDDDENQNLSSSSSSLHASRTHTYSNIVCNWEDLETQIMESPVEKPVHSARNRSATERWHQYIDRSFSSSMESEKMRIFVSDSSDKNNNYNYDDFFESLVEEHRNAVTARGDPSPGRQQFYENFKKPNPSNNNSATQIKRTKNLSSSQKHVLTSSAGSSSSLKSTTIIKSPTKPFQTEISTRTSPNIPPTELSIRTSPNTTEKQGKKRKKLFKFIPTANGNTNTTNHHSSSTSNELNSSDHIDFEEKGQSILNRFYTDPDYLILDNFLEFIKKNSSLPKSLKNSNINCLYFDNFEDDDDENTFQQSTSIENDPIFTFATIFKLIQYIVDNLDALLISVFLLTFRSIISPKELMELLICRAFSTPPSTDIDAFQSWKLKQKTIQINTQILISTWVTEYYQSDFANNDEILFLLAHLAYFLKETCTPKYIKTFLLPGLGKHVSFFLSSFFKLKITTNI